MLIYQTGVLKNVYVKISHGQRPYRNPWNLALGVNQSIRLPSSRDSLCTTGVSLPWKYPRVPDDWPKKSRQSTLPLRGGQLPEDTRLLREKEYFVLTLSLPEVTQDNLSFVFQALWGPGSVIVWGPWWTLLSSSWDSSSGLWPSVSLLRSPRSPFPQS